MKTNYILTTLSISTLLILGIFFATQKNISQASLSEKKYPLPTNGKTIVKLGEEGKEKAKREAWFEMLHQTAPGTDWKQLEYETRMNRHRHRARDIKFRSNCEQIDIADGYLSGRWTEWGSNNQAGSVFDTEFDPETGDLWLISAGGTLWKGDIYGDQWSVVNQDFRFTPGLLEFIPNENDRRLIAFTGRLPHYSDNDGVSWTAATGIIHNDNWGNIHSPIVIKGASPACYVLAKPTYYDDIKLYRSVDKGETYLPVSTFNTWDFRKLKLMTPYHSNQLYLIEKMDNNAAKIYLADPATGQLEWINQNSNIDYGGARANMAGYQDEEDNLHLYIYTNPEEGVWEVHRSIDGGINWNLAGNLPTSPWDVGIYIDPSNPEVLYMGEVECHRSIDGGQNWEKINDWWEYYDDVDGKLHADIMHFAGYQNAEGENFLLISNHGGISISYDNLETAQNISLTGLNVSQYYSVRTDPLNSQYVYAGSQDQGFQRSHDFQSEPTAAFEQVISGDYGHIVFGNDGQHLWTVYPGGWVTYYSTPQFGSYTGAYELISEEESVWLPPLMPSPYPSDDDVYMAGGNIDGGPGSYLIRLDPQGNSIQAEQIDFNFSENSGGGQLSAIATAPSDYYRWYAATTNGRFFFSEDGGYEWEQNVNFIPEGHYLYGQTICVSPNDPLTVYLGGSGYSNPPVYKSTDGGENFIDISEGLPSTLVFALTSNEDESLLFAATEAGPYVYVSAHEQWYDLSGLCAPAQTYWSVEYLAEENTARFGTYGRGIWDFEITHLSDTEVKAQEPISLYPNPASDWLNVALPSGKWALNLYNSNGQVIKSWNELQGKQQLNLHGLATGVYFYEIINVNGKQQQGKLFIR